MAGAGLSFYSIYSTEYRCGKCGTHFEVRWSELDGGKPAEAGAACPLAGCRGEARPVRDNYTVDFRRLGERLEVIEALLRARPPLGGGPDGIRPGVRVPVSLRTPLRLGILIALTGGPMRFTDLRMRLGVHDNAFILALRVLTSSGLVRKGPFTHSPYDITDEGRKVLDGVSAQKQADALPSAF